MKAYSKNRILTIIESMDEAHEILWNENDNDVYELYGVCQEAAINIGNIIEESEDNVESIITLLEDYCELLYQLSLAGDDTREGCFNSLCTIFIRIKNEINQNIPEQKTEVLFLPYNASMWDAFDSIYRAAVKNIQAHVAVMPIPYYSLDKNGAVVSERYEGQNLPAYVSVIDYKEYDMEKMQPDIIFIHNPYDQYNTVTRIHESYYSTELIKYTKHLVYVPYYLSEYKAGENLCIMPGVRNAWKVFVQSEAIREQYIKYHKKDKIVAIGSPKTDILFREKEEVLSTLPHEWRKKTTGRTVFFYNTHLNSVMGKAEHHLQKLEYILSFFKERKELAIIWRPHPLMEETIKTYNPHIFNEYRRIAAAFSELDNGIFDNTSDLHRTIALSDAYIGDAGSSVISLYGVTGKPMLYMDNTHNFKYKRLKSIRTLAGEVIKGKLWQFSWEYNAIFKLDMETLENKYINSLEEYRLADKYLYTASAAYRDKIFFIPNNADKLIVFHTVKETVQYIELEFGIHKDCIPVTTGIYLWLFPIYYSDKIHVINMENHEVISKESGYREILPNSEYVLNVPLFYGNYTAEGRVWRACRTEPFITAFDFEEKINTVYAIESSSKAYRSLTFDGVDFWILAMGKANIIRWNRASGAVEEFNNFPESIDREEERLFSDLFCYNGNVWLIPLEAQRIIKINILTGKMEEIDYHTEHFVLDYEDAEAFIKYFVEDNLLFLMPYQCNVIIKINMDDCRVEELANNFPSDYSKEEWVEYITHETGRNTHLDKIGHIYREETCSLEYFSDIVKNRKEKFGEERKACFAKNSINVDGTCGEKIWSYVEKEL